MNFLMSSVVLHPGAPLLASGSQPTVLNSMAAEILKGIGRPLSGGQIAVESLRDTVTPIVHIEGATDLLELAESRKHELNKYVLDKAEPTEGLLQDLNGRQSRLQAIVDGLETNREDPEKIRTLIADLHNRFQPDHPSGLLAKLLAGKGVAFNMDEPDGLAEIQRTLGLILTDAVIEQMVAITEKPQLSDILHAVRGDRELTPEDIDELGEVIDIIISTKNEQKAAQEERIVGYFRKAGRSLENATIAKVRDFLEPLFEMGLLSQMTGQIAATLLQLRAGLELSPEQERVLAHNAARVIDSVNIASGVKNTQRAVTRDGSAELRQIWGKIQKREPGEALTLSKILKEKEKYRKEGVRIVQFDFDGTIRQTKGLFRLGQLWWEWLAFDVLPHTRHSVGASFLSALTLSLVGLMNLVPELLTGEPNKTLTRKIIRYAMQHSTPEQLWESFDRFARYYGAIGFSAEAVERLYDHISEGDLVIISSASPMDLVKRVIAYLGVPEENVQGTTFAVVEDEYGETRFKETYQFHWNHGPEKNIQLAALVTDRLDAEGIPYKRVHAYSDGQSDREMLYAAQVPHTINTSRRRYEEEMIHRGGDATREQGGLWGLVLGGNEGTIWRRSAQWSRGEWTKKGTYQVEQAPYLKDWGRALAEGSQSGLAYYLGTLGTELIHQVTTSGTENLGAAFRDPNAVVMGAVTFALSTPLNYFMVRDGSSSWMRRAVVQRALPLLGATWIGNEFLSKWFNLVSDSRNAFAVQNSLAVAIGAATALGTFGWFAGREVGGVFGEFLEPLPTVETGKEAIRAMAEGPERIDAVTTPVDKLVAVAVSEEETSDAEPGDSLPQDESPAEKATLIKGSQGTPRVGIPEFGAGLGAAFGIAYGAIKYNGSPADFSSTVVLIASIMGVALLSESMATAASGNIRKRGLDSGDERSWLAALSRRGVGKVVEVLAYRYILPLLGRLG